MLRAEQRRSPEMRSASRLDKEWQRAGECHRSLSQCRVESSRRVESSGRSGHFVKRKEKTKLCISMKRLFTAATATLLDLTRISIATLIVIMCCCGYSEGGRKEELNPTTRPPQSKKEGGVIPLAAAAAAAKSLSHVALPPPHHHAVAALVPLNVQTLILFPFPGNSSRCIFFSPIDTLDLCVCMHHLAHLLLCLPIAFDVQQTITPATGRSVDHSVTL